MIFFLLCSNFSQLSLYDRKNNQYLSSCPYLTPVKSRRKRICRLKQNTHSLVCYQAHFIHSRTAPGKKTGGGFVDCLTTTLPLCWECPLLLEILSPDNFPKGMRCLGSRGSAGPGLLHQGQPSTEPEFEAEVLLRFPR